LEYWTISRVPRDCIAAPKEECGVESLCVSEDLTERCRLFDRLCCRSIVAGNNERKTGARATRKLARFWNRRKRGKASVGLPKNYTGRQQRN
jgi:hypothetical protein